MSNRFPVGDPPGDLRVWRVVNGSKAWYEAGR
jgi:hypothetical protein